jgi:hypothetical protein
MATQSTQTAPEAPDAAEYLGPYLIEVETSGRDRTKLVPNVRNLYSWLAEQGFGVHRPAGELLDLYRFRTDAPVVQRVHEFDLMHCVDAHLGAGYGVPVGWASPSEAVEVLNKFGRYKIYSKQNYVNLPVVELPANRHGADSATFYFQDSFVTLRRGKPMQVAPLAELPHPIRAEQLQPRGFRAVTPAELSGPELVTAEQPDRAAGYRGRDFLRFLTYISSDVDNDGNAKRNEPKLIYLFQLLGYLLHDHRRKGYTDRCVILCDDEAGGTGKGILSEAISQLTPLCLVDAKKDKDFSPNELTTATRVKVYNDITRTFHFEGVYNEITDGGHIRHMNRPPVHVPYSDTWKVVITSNWLIRGDKASDRRRQWVYDMSLYFDEKRSPKDTFGHSFFSSEWDADDWAVFYNVLLLAVQSWLDCDYAPNVYETDDYRRRQIETEYPMVLREYLDALPAGQHATGDLYRTFVARQETKDSVCKHWHTTTFGRKIIEYWKATGREVIKNAKKTHVRLGPLPAPPPVDPAELAALDYAPPPGAQLNCPF